MNPVLVISKWGVDGVQIIPGARIALSVAESLEKHLCGKAWVDHSSAYAYIAIHLNSNDPGLRDEVLNLTASFFRDR